jgi:phosphatidylinositol-3-phosphatase
MVVVARVALCLALVALAGCASSARQPPAGPFRPAHPCGTRATHPPVYRHVLWIWMENKSYSRIIGSSSAPYTNQLAQHCGVATNYTAITHPSLPNYLAATSGDFWGIKDDKAPSSHPLAVSSIYSQVKAMGKTWREYEESAPSNCPLSSSGQYAVKHDPAPYYTGIRADCANWDVPMGSTTAGNLRDDLSANTLPDFAFLTPNLCNDTHDCSISTGDDWLKGWFQVLLTSTAYKSGTTAIFLTYDEDDGSASNRIVTIVVSPYTPAGTTSATAFNHYSLLKTTEELLGLGGFLAHAGDGRTNSMRSAFGL